MKDNNNLIEKIYIVLFNNETKTFFIKVSTTKNIETLKKRFKENPNAFLQPKKIRALSTDEAMIKACNVYGLDPKQCTLDKTRTHNLVEIEDFNF